VVKTLCLHMCGCFTATNSFDFTRTRDKMHTRFPQGTEKGQEKHEHDGANHSGCTINWVLNV
jgi:hypothetical protein